ncbi:metal ABC transporter ATP-binding protein [Clostridium thermarum]|uniref:metal ABC transporter ATP-binding protein n=1 Tax=Clostridium thermarum TaxID=1716543 RepID=UPI001120C9E8|nr:metal ABC transporter ATP-binding protein [Clostridium thermarum]
MLVINNLSFSYNGDSSLILKDINFKAERGDYISILGDNGSGKSTLLKLILNFLKPNKGTISIYSDKIGYVPQRFESFNSGFPITVQEVLNIHRKALRIKDARVIDEVLSTVNMMKFKKHLIGQLSGGQRQKIFIARALMGLPELLILDEPSTGIDVESQIDIYDILKHLNKHHKITIISVEHNLQAAYKNSNKIFYMSNGRGKLSSSQEFFIDHDRGDLHATI